MHIELPIQIIEAKSSPKKFKSQTQENVSLEDNSDIINEEKIKKVVKAQWTGSYSVMVVDGKTYKINDEQRKNLEKIMPKVQVNH